MNNRDVSKRQEISDLLRSGWGYGETGIGHIVKDIESIKPASRGDGSETECVPCVQDMALPANV